MKKLELLAKAVVGVEVSLTSAEQFNIELLRRDIQTHLNAMSNNNARATDVMPALLPLIEKVQVLLTKLAPDSMADVYLEGETLFNMPPCCADDANDCDCDQPDVNAQHVKVVGKINIDDYEQAH